MTTLNLRLLVFTLLSLVLPTSILATPLSTTRQVGIPCGPNVCTNGTVCCNRSCGTCTKPGDKCLAVICPKVVVEAAPVAAEKQKRQDIPRLRQCGSKKCGMGQRCCNAACGHCVGPFEVCLPSVCDIKLERDIRGREWEGGAREAGLELGDGMERANGMQRANGVDLQGPKDCSGCV